MINGRGRAPLIVVPDTGTRPQTKQDRAGAGCHAQSPSSRKPVCCSREFGGKRGHKISGSDSRGELRRDLSIQTTVESIGNVQCLAIRLGWGIC